MSDFYSLLIKLDTLVTELSGIMETEEKELSLLKVDPVRLQSLADNKQRTISAIHFYDKQRANFEKVLGLSVPYAEQHQLTDIWKSICNKVQQANRIHDRIGYLIAQHLKKIAYLQAAIRGAEKERFIYKPCGDKEKTSPVNFYNISV